MNNAVECKVTADGRHPDWGQSDLTARPHDQYMSPLAAVTHLDNT